ncbi:caspase, EACC1-associated type [Streptomyces albipurpureus]|uniref:Caspase family protein n=1 Tax=Streptomyces albipurpureus TaxID=2897419 RepID=A0ABT0UGK3_9ACTN|nr:caspase family protein [Streptomyces sp. CWNU-1]MCM2387554.1 caspase family protein [Streptomyces sp. CWNU-1]
MSSGRLPDPAASRVVLIGVSDFVSTAGRAPHALPAVRNNLRALEGLFGDRLWSEGAVHCTRVENPAFPVDLVKAVRCAVAAATDTLVIYYAGHGLIDSQGELHLAVGHSDAGFVRDTAVEYKRIGEELRASRATRRIVVLDCCFAARAFGAQSAEPDFAMDGTYVLAAAGETVMAVSPPGGEFTAFTGALVDVLRTGVPGGPEYLSLDALFVELTCELAEREGPAPQRQCQNRVGATPFARNAAVGTSATASDTRPAPPAPGRHQKAAGPRNRRRRMLLAAAGASAVGALVYWQLPLDTSAREKPPVSAKPAVPSSAPSASQSTPAESTPPSGAESLRVKLFKDGRTANGNVGIDVTSLVGNVRRNGVNDAFGGGEGETGGGAAVQAEELPGGSTSGLVDFHVETPWGNCTAEGVAIGRSTVVTARSGPWVRITVTAVENGSRADAAVVTFRVTQGRDKAPEGNETCA